MEDVAGLAADRAGGFWADKRVLVTGATGVVGSWVVAQLLAGGAHVVALVRDPDPRSELYRSGAIQRCAVVAGSVERFATVERAIVEHDVDSVIHLAAQTIVGTAQRAPLATFEANVRGSYMLLDACRQQADLVKRVAIASSDKAYGDQGQRHYDESAPLAARHPYDVSKACADLLAQAYAHSYDLPVAIARCGNIYGGGDLNWSRIVPGTVRSLLRGEPPLIRSDGTMVRDYLYVEDAAAAYLALARQADHDGVRGQGFNFSPEAPIGVLDLVERIRARIGPTAPAPIVQGIARHEIPYQALSSARARDVLGWRPCYDLEAGLERTIAWYRAFLDPAA